jgi:hypothetical protein
MKLSALRKRATAAGVPEAEVEAAEDSGRPTEALIELLLAVQGASPSVTAGADVTAADVLPPAVRQTSMQRRSWQPLRKCIHWLSFTRLLTTGSPGLRAAGLWQWAM